MHAADSTGGENPDAGLMGDMQRGGHGGATAELVGEGDPEIARADFAGAVKVR